MWGDVSLIFRPSLQLSQFQTRSISALGAKRLAYSLQTAQRAFESRSCYSAVITPRADSQSSVPVLQSRSDDAPWRTSSLSASMWAGMLATWHYGGMERKSIFLRFAWKVFLLTLTGSYHSSVWHAVHGLKNSIARRKQRQRNFPKISFATSHAFRTSMMMKSGRRVASDNGRRRTRAWRSLYFLVCFRN